MTEESVVRQVIPTNNFALGSSVSDEQISEQHSKCARQLRISKRAAFEILLTGSQFAVTNNEEASNSDVEPILFEECYVKDGEASFVKSVQNSTAVKPIATGKSEGANLFVMVHGFQGSS